LGQSLTTKEEKDDPDLDRVIHNAYRIELAGESMRKRRMPEPSA
jgi:hypothetical protein